MPPAEPSPRRDDEPDDILARAPSRIGRISLVVRDLERMGRFYRDDLGLVPIAEEARTLHLGVGGSVLLTLLHEPGARPWMPHEAGLYHTAFLLPSREDLGAWLAHAAGRRLRLDGASDHLVSEAVYLTDPEGNGIEIYADRPSTTWAWAGGAIQMAVERLDLQKLMRAAGRVWAGMPVGSSVGHVHLQVGDLLAADAFYAALLGFDIVARLRGAHFYSTGGYHHQLAGNIWHSMGAGPARAGSTGLREIQLLLKDESDLTAVSARLSAAGGAADGSGGDILASDPWGTRFRLTGAVMAARTP